MKFLVAYMSQTGNTKKVADAIFGAIRGEKEIRPLAEVTSLDGYDLAFVGFPMHAGGPAKPAEAFLQQHSRGKNVALFVTHASYEDGPGVPEALDKCKAAAAGANMVGLFHCQGALSEAIADFMLKSGDPGLAAAAKQRGLTTGQPDATRLKRARAFARDVVKQRADR